MSALNRIWIDNVEYVTKASIGDWVVRVLKKDGSPSKIYEKAYSYNSDLPHGWRTKGESK